MNPNPTQGGSYVRQKDGSLQRVAFTEPAITGGAPIEPRDASPEPAAENDDAAAEPQQATGGRPRRTKE